MKPSDNKYAATKRHPPHFKNTIVIYFLVLIPLIALVFTNSCQNPVTQNSERQLLVSDSTISLNKDTVLFYIDSFQIVNFLDQYPAFSKYKEEIESYYAKRHNEFAWLSSTGCNEYAKNFINLLNHEKLIAQNDSALYLNRVSQINRSIDEMDYPINSKHTRVNELELLLTSEFFDYAKRNWIGINSIKEKQIEWFITPQKLKYENLLDTFLKNDPQAVYSFQPVYRQYGLLKKYLQKYYSIEKKGGWAFSNESIRQLKLGDTSIAIISIKQQLFMLEDLSLNDSTDLFNDNLKNAVIKFQKRNGIESDGVIAGKTLTAMRVNVKSLIQKILINMERCKWVPVEQRGDYLAVNIPEFKLHVYHNDSLLWSCKAVVGKSKIANNTVIFNDYLEDIVFSPYWNIPDDIIINEVLPGIKRNPSYLDNHNMEIVNGSGSKVAASSITWKKYSNNFPYIIRQKPGKNNALGLVKFLFPNSYQIYMHDTPEKSLFSEQSRMFSHGCIRLQEPLKLAKFLLRDDSTYTEEKIKNLMNGGKEKYVKMKQKVPVFIAYFTAWVDREGELNFRDDVYNHDIKMKQLLFKD